MPEPFEYNKTITTTLSKLAIQFPNDTFCISIRKWFYGRIYYSNKFDDILYTCWIDSKQVHVEGSSLEEIYNKAIELLK